mmetsp:Transcript_81906/g.264387  ORF Transcript_81906/g.264387 Transcript_81906/m.264387 type:complete len:286 (-) Transcript_81906:74-931(-)
MRFTDQSPLYSGLSFVGASHSPSSSSSQSSGFLASVSTMRFSSTQSAGFLSSGSSIMESSTQSLGFFVVRVGDLLGREHLPVLLQGALVDFLLIDLHDYRVVRLHHQPVEVRSALALLFVGEVRLLQNVLALVVEDQVCPLGVAALVRAKHDVVARRVTEGRGIAHLRADLHVAATALHVLLVLGLVLNDQLLALVAEGLEACRKAEEFGVLAGLDALVLDLIREPLAGAGDPLTRCALALLPLARSPTALPAITKGLREVDFAAGHAHKAHAKRSSAHHSWKMG